VIIDRTFQLIGGVVLLLGLLAVGTLYASKKSLERQLNEAKVSLGIETERTARLNDQIKDLTTAKEVVVQKTTVAKQKRRQVQKTIKERIELLILEAPPAQCDAAIEWAIENKGDLQW